MTRTHDIKVNGNIIGGRQGYAYICNSMKFAVLMADMDKDQKYEDYQTFGKVRVAYTHRGHESFTVGTLEVEKGNWSIGSWGCCLHSQFGFTDMYESIQEANVPVIRKGDIVAIALHSKKIEFVSIMLFKVGAVDSNCQTVTRFIPLTDEEMENVKKDGNAWVNSFI